MLRIRVLLFLVGLGLASVPAPAVFGWAQGLPPIPTRPTKAVGAEIGGAALSIRHEYPFLQGEKIFGGTVPYDRLWCPGRGGCPRFSTDHSLQFPGLKLEAGEYSLWMMPTETSWTLTFNTNSRGASQARHNPTLDVGSTVLQKQMLSSPVDQLAFALEEGPAPSSGVMAMAWEHTRVSVAFTVLR